MTLNLMSRCTVRWPVVWCWRWAPSIEFIAPQHVVDVWMKRCNGCWVEVNNDWHMFHHKCYPPPMNRLSDNCDAEWHGINVGKVIVEFFFFLFCYNILFKLLFRYMCMCLDLNLLFLINFFVILTHGCLMHMQAREKREVSTWNLSLSFDLVEQSSFFKYLLHIWWADLSSDCSWQMVFVDLFEDYFHF